jgi:dihydroorotase
MGSLLISGGTIVNEGRRQVGYIVVRDGVIAETGEGEYPLSRDFGGTRIDARGKIVMPGVIDPHVHFREPGLTAKGDMATESAAAVAGGVTSVLEMPNTVPPAVTRDEIARKFDLADGRMHTNYSFFLGATADNIGEIERFWADGGRLVKLFTGSSTGGMLVTDRRAIAALFDRFGGVVAAHCEDEDIIRAASERYRRDVGERATAAIHPLVRSAEACYVATARTIELARRYDARLHVCHLTTARELALFDAGPTAGKRITAEACVPHLWFTDGDYAQLGNRIKCNPAVKTAADRAALREALAGVGERSGVGEWGGRIDLVATDHAPHTAEEKARGYWEAPSGMPSVQHSLPVMFALAGQGVLTLETVVERMCHAPAVRFGIVGRGFLREGYAADIAIVDPDVRSAGGEQGDGGGQAGGDGEHGGGGETGWVVGPGNILSKCGWSPWEGVRFGARVVCTLVGGRIAWDGQRVVDTAAGERLLFN